MFCPHKKITSRTIRISGTLIVIKPPKLHSQALFIFIEFFRKHNFMIFQNIGVEGRPVKVLTVLGYLKNNFDKSSTIIYFCIKINETTQSKCHIFFRRKIRRRIDADIFATALSKPDDIIFKTSLSYTDSSLSHTALRAEARLHQAGRYGGAQQAGRSGEADRSRRGAGRDNQTEHSAGCSSSRQADGASHSGKRGRQPGRATQSLDRRRAGTQKEEPAIGQEPAASTRRGHEDAIGGSMGLKEQLRGHRKGSQVSGRKETKLK
jgi:hypothetical protein